MTLDYTIVRICPREFQAGLFYTGCSRVKEMEKLAIVGYTTRIRENGQETEFPSKQRWGLPGRNILIYFFFFFIRFMNMKQKGIPKNTKGKAKGKEGVIVKRDRELEKKRVLFNDLLQRLDQNSNSVMETDSEWLFIIYYSIIFNLSTYFRCCQPIITPTTMY